MGSEMAGGAYTIPIPTAGLRLGILHPLFRDTIRPIVDHKISLNAVLDFSLSATKGCIVYYIVYKLVTISAPNPPFPMDAFSHPTEVHLPLIEVHRSPRLPTIFQSLYHSIFSLRLLPFHLSFVGLLHVCRTDLRKMELFVALVNIELG
jgi:hypothetical protein